MSFIFEDVIEGIPEDTRVKFREWLAARLIREFGEGFKAGVFAAENGHNPLFSERYGFVRTEELDV